MTANLDLAAAEAWIRGLVEPSGDIVLERHRAWATIVRVPTVNGTAWFKACSPVQAFEPRLTAELSGRWPDRVVRVLGHDVERAWLLTADAGDPVASHGNDPTIWLRALPSYAELQRGEIAYVARHLDSGVPDRRVQALPAMYDGLLRSDLPIEGSELDRLRGFATAFARLCDELAATSPIASIQHDDLHLRSLFVDGPALRVVDWGDACVSHPFATLVVTFRWLERENGLAPANPWFARLRDAYLEPWGGGQVETFELAARAGLVAQAVGWLRHRNAMPDVERLAFDLQFAELLRRILTRVVNA